MGNVQCCESKTNQTEETIATPVQLASTQLPEDTAFGVQVADCQKACEDSGACYAIFWSYDSVNRCLRPMCHYNPPERVAAVKAKTGSDKMYTTESFTTKMKPGEGFVGKCYLNHESMFFQDVSQIPDAEYKRKSLAAQYGIVSVALKPYMDGVMEVGATRKWEACHWIHTVTAIDCERAAREAGASFAIFWGFCEEKGVLRPVCHWNPPERIAEVKAKTGSDELYTTESYRFEMTPGTGLMGKCFRDRQWVFHQDVSQLSVSDFKRKSLAARFGVVSLAFKPFENGVMEVGSAKKWEECAWASLMSVEDCKWAAREAGADFAMFWGFDKARGVLRPMCHWNPPERIAAVKAATGKEDLYTTESYQSELKPGAGFVGKVYQDGMPMFLSDVSNVLASEFARKELAKKYGIVSLGLKPFGDGVMEIGTSKRWESCEWVKEVKPQELERAAKDAGASFAIYWGFDEGRGILRPMCHWNPPERIAEMKAQTGSDELYTTESYRFPLKPGAGYVGRCYSNKETMFLADVSNVPTSEFKRQHVAERFGVTSLALKPYANGVLEVGSAKKWESCEWANRVTVEDCERVAKETGASFCLYWSLDKTKGTLSALSHWNPPERVAVVKASTGKNELYTTESYKSEFKLGVGVVGKACKNKETMFFQDVSSINVSEYKRKDLAAKYGIVSLALKPFGDGVYEIGWSSKCSGCDWLNTMTVDDCRRACLDIKGSFAIFWGMDQAKQVLRPLCHWNPPERIAELRAATGSDALYTTESYTSEFKPGVGFVGKVYKDKKAMNFPDVSKVSSADFKRKELATRFGVQTLVYVPFANGVLEVGSAMKMDTSSYMGA